MINHYRTLGIDPAADDQAIRRAYLAQMRRFHPDRVGGEADAAKAQAVAAAYAVLRDPEQRAAYDRKRTHFLHGEMLNGNVQGGAAVARARGGHLGRNLFILLAAGTGYLAYVAVQQSTPTVGQPAARSTAAAPKLAEREAEPRLVPPEAAPIEADRPPEPEVIVPEPVEVADEVVIPPLPTLPPARVARPTALPTAPRHTVARAAPAPAPRRSAPVAAAAPAPAPAAAPERPAAANLADLQRHLRLLTDQSLRYGSAKKQARVAATTAPFTARLNACTTDSCRRDLYLSRNAEIAEIMRN